MKDYYNSKLFIIKIQNYLSKKLHFRLLASLLIIFIPAFITALILQTIYEYKILSRAVIISLIWVAVAPLLIQDAFFIFHNFFDSHKHLIDDEEKWKEIKKKFIAKFESKRFIITDIIWALICTLLIIFIIFADAPSLIQLWVFIVYFILFMLSATGIRGLLLITKIITYLCKIKMKIDPLHYDSFGGVQSFGKFIIQGTFYFSTGALLFPLVFEMLKTVSQKDINIILIIYLLTTAFIVLLIYNFIAPVYTLKRYMEKEKNKLLIESWDKTKKLYKKAKNDDTGKFPVDLYFHTEIYHKKTQAIKTYPYDTTVIFELFASVVLPIAIGILEIIKFD